MHDPMVVAFEIRRPWPRVSDTPLPGKRGKARWDVRWSAFWMVAGRRWYWPSVVTIWHVEPDGHDSGTVCKPYRTAVSGKRVVDNSWRWHLHHWKVQIQPAQALRRWLLTRCEWCGGPSRKGAPVNCSHQWDRKPGSWWRGESGLLHASCSSVWTASRACLCALPITEHDGWGCCAICGKHRAYGRTEANTAYMSVMAQCPPGTHPTSSLLAEANHAHDAALVSR